jgi:hypothetical protein
MRITNQTQPNETQHDHFTTRIRLCEKETETGWTEIHEILHGCYATPHYSIIVLSNSSHSVIRSWRVLKLTRWDDENAISRDPLRMRSTDLTQPKTAKAIRTSYPPVGIS